MNEVVRVEPIDAVWNRIVSSDSVAYELWEKFSFKVPGYQHTPAYKKGRWTGEIRLFKMRDRKMYGGHLQALDEFCRQNDYEMDLSALEVAGWRPLMESERQAFLDRIGLPKEMAPRPYQWSAFDEAITHRRRLYLSPTASGKSLIMYLIFRYLERKTLIIVPTVGLVHQLAQDFAEYGYDSDHLVCKIFAEQDAWSDRPCTISTWQSAIKQTPEWFQRFTCFEGDEAHLFSAASLTTIAEALTEADCRFGFTGTLNGSKTHQMVLEGLFGTVSQVISYAELIKNGWVARPIIHMIVLVHPKPKKKVKRDYPTEYDFVVNCEARTRFLANLAVSLKGNTLLLFKEIKDHGDVISELISNKLEGTGRPFHYVHGGVKALERNEIRSQIEQETDAIFAASEGTTSTGVNVKRLHNLVKGSPSKGIILNLQSLGRGLRIGSDKTELNVYDVADDMTHVTRGGNEMPNFGMKHMAERVKIYMEQGFEVKTYRIDLRYEL